MILIRHQESQVQKTLDSQSLQLMEPILSSCARTYYSCSKIPMTATAVLLFFLISECRDLAFAFRKLSEPRIGMIEPLHRPCTYLRARCLPSSVSDLLAWVAIQDFMLWYLGGHLVMTHFLNIFAVGVVQGGRGEERHRHPVHMPKGNPTTQVQT